MPGSSHGSNLSDGRGVSGGKVIQTQRNFHFLPRQPAVYAVQPLLEFPLLIPLHRLVPMCSGSGGITSGISGGAIPVAGPEPHLWRRHRGYGGGDWIAPQNVLRTSSCIPEPWDKETAMTVKANLKAGDAARSATAFLRVSPMTPTRTQMRPPETA
jgi:hypothetical protein